MVTEATSLRDLPEIKVPAEVGAVLDGMERGQLGFLGNLQILTTDLQRDPTLTEKGLQTLDFYSGPASHVGSPNLMKVLDWLGIKLKKGRQTRVGFGLTDSLRKLAGAHPQESTDSGKWVSGTVDMSTIGRIGMLEEYFRKSRAEKFGAPEAVEAAEKSTGLIARVREALARLHGDENSTR